MTKQGSFFRRFFSVTLSLLVVLSLCACSGKSDGGTSRTRNDMRTSSDGGRTGRTGNGGGTGGSGTGAGNSGNTASTGETDDVNWQPVDGDMPPVPQETAIEGLWEYLSYVNLPHTGYYFFPDGEWVAIPLMHATVTSSDDLQFLDSGYYEYAYTEGRSQVYNMVSMSGDSLMTAKLSYTPAGNNMSNYQLDLSNGDTVYGGGADEFPFPAAAYCGKWVGEGVALDLMEDGPGVARAENGEWWFSVRFAPGSGFIPSGENTFEQRLYTYAFFADQGYYMCADLAYFEEDDGSDYIKVTFCSVLADACGIPRTVTMKRRVI